MKRSRGFLAVLVVVGVLLTACQDPAGSAISAAPGEWDAATWNAALWE